MKKAVNPRAKLNKEKKTNSPSIERNERAERESPADGKIIKTEQDDIRQKNKRTKKANDREDLLNRHVS